MPSDYNQRNDGSVTLERHTSFVWGVRQGKNHKDKCELFPYSSSFKQVFRLKGNPGMNSKETGIESAILVDLIETNIGRLNCLFFSL